MSKPNRFYTTINEAKQLMKLSIYEKWIKDKADMTHMISAGVPDLGIKDYDNLVVGSNNSSYTRHYPAWSTDALIKVCNDLEIVLYIDSDGVLVTKFSADYCHNEFEYDITGTCLPWMLVKILKKYDNEHGTK